MNGLTFGHPQWFWAILILVPLLLLRVLSQIRGAKQLPGLVSPRLQKSLIRGNSQLTAWAVFLLQSVAMAATITALARPQMGFVEIDTETEGRNLIIAIDTSRSMLANDLPPNRLVRAKLAANDIISSLPDDRVGLIAFAGRPFLQAPLTMDHEAVIESTDQLDTEIIPRGGTNIAKAVEMAIETVDEAGIEQSAMVIFSDGEALEGLEEVERIREKAANSGLTILGVGVGTQSGSIIPELDRMGKEIPGQFVMDDDGQVVRSRLAPEALQALASNGGAYIHLGGKASLTRVVEQIKEGIATSREDSEARLRPVERFIWPLAVAILALILAHIIPSLGSLRSTPNRPLVNAALLLGILVFSPGESAAKDVLERGFEAMQNEEYDLALDRYEAALAEKQTRYDKGRIHLNLGAAAFKKGDFERAAEAFGQTLTHDDKTLREQAHYNLGNALFRQGQSALLALGGLNNPDQPQTLSSPDEAVESTIRQWEGAIEHFESTLGLNQNNDRAAHNRDVVKKKLEELKKEQEKQKQEQEEKQEEEQQQEEEEKEDEEQEQDSESEDQEQDDSGKDGNQEQEPNESESEESDENEKGDQENQQDSKEGDEPQDEEKPQENQDGEGDESKGEPEGDRDESDEEGENDEPRPQPEPEEEEDPKEGELGADPDGERPEPEKPESGEPENQPQPGSAAQAQAMETNPETGYSPTDARQLLEALADETEVRPILPPSRGEVFKNW